MQRNSWRKRQKVLLCCNGKRCLSILSASKEWNDVLEIAVGEVVHVSRYARYTNKRSIEQDKKNLVVTLLT